MTAGLRKMREPFQRWINSGETIDVNDGGSHQRIYLERKHCWKGEVEKVYLFTPAELRTELERVARKAWEAALDDYCSRNDVVWSHNNFEDWLKQQGEDL